MKIKLIILILFSLVLVLNCSYFEHKINTWNDFCDHLLERDNDSFIISFDYPAIRNDFIKQYNDLFIQNIAYFNMGKLKRDDKLVKEFERLKMIGVETRDNNIIINNTFWVYENELEEWKNKYKTYLNAIKSDNADKLDDYQTCMYHTIDSFFDKLILNGNDNKQKMIKLDFTLKSYLN